MLVPSLAPCPSVATPTCRRICPPNPRARRPKFRSKIHGIVRCLASDSIDIRGLVGLLRRAGFSPWLRPRPERSVEVTAHASGVVPAHTFIGGDFGDACVDGCGSSSHSPYPHLVGMLLASLLKVMTSMSVMRMIDVWLPDGRVTISVRDYFNRIGVWRDHSWRSAKPQKDWMADGVRARVRGFGGLERGR